MFDFTKGLERQDAAAAEEKPKELFVEQEKPTSIEGRFVKGVSEQTGKMVGVLLERYFNGEITREEIEKQMIEDLGSTLNSLDGIKAKKN